MAIRYNLKDERYPRAFDNEKSHRVFFLYLKKNFLNNAEGGGIRKPWQEAAYVQGTPPHPYYFK